QAIFRTVNWHVILQCYAAELIWTNPAAICHPSAPRFVAPGRSRLGFSPNWMEKRACPAMPIMRKPVRGMITRAPIFFSGISHGGCAVREHPRKLRSLEFV